jgi:hypothetical protein
LEQPASKEATNAKTNQAVRPDLQTCSRVVGCLLMVEAVLHPSAGFTKPHFKIKSGRRSPAS